MANPNKAKGTAQERLVADYLRDNYSEFIDRRTLSGGADKGDLVNVRVGKHRLVVEVKNHARLDLADWIKEAAQEAANDHALAGIVVAKRKGKAQPQDQYVIMTLGDLVKILNAIAS